MLFTLLFFLLNEVMELMMDVFFTPNHLLKFQNDINALKLTSL